MHRAQTKLTWTTYVGRKLDKPLFDHQRSMQINPAQAVLRMPFIHYHMDELIVCRYVMPPASTTGGQTIYYPTNLEFHYPTPFFTYERAWNWEELQDEARAHAEAEGWLLCGHWPCPDSIACKAIFDKPGK